MDLAAKYLVVWLSPEAIETFLGILEPSQEHAMTTSPARSWARRAPACGSR
jgi:hypothetical protein